MVSIYTGLILSLMQNNRSINRRETNRLCKRKARKDRQMENQRQRRDKRIDNAMKESKYPIYRCILKKMKYKHMNLRRKKKFIFDRLRIEFFELFMSDKLSNLIIYA